jgi:hypothetical protein
MTNERSEEMQVHDALLARWHSMPSKWRKCGECGREFASSPTVTECLLHLAIHDIIALRRSSDSGKSHE